MKPNLSQLTAILRTVAGWLDVESADYCFEGRFRFRLGGDWSLVISPDYAGRLRLAACQRSRVRATMWCAVEDAGRLQALVVAARDEALALTV